jgi:hypothetical protein
VKKEEFSHKDTKNTKSWLALWCKVIIAQTMDAFFEGGHPKVHHETQRKARKPQICQQLLGVNSGVALSRFQLDQNFIFDQKICPKAIVEGSVAIADRD